jgi:hypothetical protein
MQAVAGDPKHGAEAQQLWQEHQAFRAEFSSPAEAQALKQASQSVDRIDAAIFSGDARAQSEVVAELARANPAAFRALFAEAAKVLSGMGTSQLVASAGPTLRENGEGWGAQQTNIKRQDAPVVNESAMPSRRPFLRQGEQDAGATTAAAESSLTNQESRFTNHQSPATSIPADLVLRVYADGTPTNGAGFLVENIEIFPTTEPYNTSLVRASFAEDPESYDGVSGFLNISEDDGQAVRAAFLLRERLYFVKERSIYVTADDGVNEPASWTINEVSRTVGTPSVAGVDTGEDWAVIAGRAGLYMFDGGEPVKISQEIQPLWDQINWAAGKTLWVRVDTRNKRILCGVPIGAATSPNRILVLDYRSLASAGEIESLGSVLFSTLSGKLYAVGRSRKWCPWNITASSCTLAERADGTSQMFFGNGGVSGAGNGKIYQLSDTQFSDDGAAINSYYTTYFFLSNDLEQTYQVRSHRKLFAYLTAYAEGAGNLSLSAFIGNEAYPTALAPLALSSPAPKDLEMLINLLGERVAFQVGTNAVGAWFKLERFVPSLLPDPWAPVRGGN